MVQDCLNRTAGHLWGIISNGSVLRLLRDTTSLTGAAYLEVDLAAMFDGELFEDFVLLYRLLHVSRFEVADGAPVSTCRMERWRTEAIEAGTRALDQLRDGVKTRSSRSAPAFSSTQRTPPSARILIRTWPSAPFSASCTACSSGSSPKTATPCSPRAPMTRPDAVRGVLLCPAPPRRLAARGRYRPR